MANGERRKPGYDNPINPDAAGAIKSARAGQCRDAMKHLYDASPHVQGRECSMTGPVANAFRQASVIVSGLCTVNKKAGIPYTGFGRPKRRRRN